MDCRHVGASVRFSVAAFKRFIVELSEQWCKWLDTLACWLAKCSHVAETRSSVSLLEDVAVSPPDVAQDDDPGIEGSADPSVEDLELAGELGRSVRARGFALTDPDGMLNALSKAVIETALDEEMAERLGYDEREVAGRNRGNSRNGVRTKVVLTDNVGRLRSPSRVIVRAPSAR